MQATIANLAVLYEGKICTLFLLLVLTIQILPIQQMGGLLFSNRFTEEIPHAHDTDSGF